MGIYLPYILCVFINFPIDSKYDMTKSYSSPLYTPSLCMWAHLCQIWTQKGLSFGPWSTVLLLFRRHFNRVVLRGNALTFYNAIQAFLWNRRGDIVTNTPSIINDIYQKF